MNKVILRGRLTRNPEVRYTTGENALAIARYTLAVKRRSIKEGDATADYIPCVAFGRLAEVAEQYFKKGMLVTISGRIQTGSYTNNEGNRIFTTEVVIEEQEFTNSKSSVAQEENEEKTTNPEEEYMAIPTEGELPFN